MNKKKYSINTTDKQTLLDWYRLMRIGRMMDEQAPNYLLQSLGWSFHAPYAGHDGIQLALGQAFTRGEDALFLYYRDMLSALSAGLTPKEIILNGISKATELTSGGRHMSNHFCKIEWGIQNPTSCVGSADLHAVGYARALKYYGKRGVAITSHGDSTTSEGYVYEAINGASREKLPVIFVIQDNGYGISVQKKDQTGNVKVAKNFESMANLRVMYCNGKDVFDSMNCMAEAREYAIENHMPVMVHANCVRMGSHSNSDKQSLYRDDAELSYVKANDPLERYIRMLIRYKRATREELEKIDAEVKKLLSDSKKSALQDPDPTPESIYNFVTPEPYAGTKYGRGIYEGEEKGEKKTLVTAINETLKAEFRHNPDTFLWGQDVANKDKGGVFNVTKGMQAEFGAGRVFNAPIAEDFIVGTANGMSRFDDKIRIVIEGAEFADYFWPAMEQYVNTTHEYWRSNGQFSPNVTIRLASAGYIGGGLYHSQTIEASLVPLPGARIAYPCFADDAAGLLRTAIRSRGLNVFLEPKAQYNNVGTAAYFPDDFEVPFGKGRIRAEGSDLTIVTYGNTVVLSLQVAERIKQEMGKTIEVIDLRTLLPWDKDLVFESIQKTSKALVVHEDKVFGGFGGEVVATIADQAFRDLDAPVRRVGSTFTPVGFHHNLERAVLPSAQRIYDAAKELILY